MTKSGVLCCVLGSIRALCIAMLFFVLSIFALFGSCFSVRAADTSGWWNVWGTAGMIPYSYDSYYKAQWTAFSSTGQASMLYRDSLYGSGATVVTLSGGTTWVTVGSPGFSSGATLDGRIAIGPNGTLYVAYIDAANGNTLAVKTFNGTSWVDMGSSYFSTMTPNFWLNLVVSPGGVPYVAFQDTVTGYLGVYRYSGGSWQAVWASVNHARGDFVNTTGFEPTLQFWPDGMPYVSHYGGPGLQIWKFNGTSWNLVGGTIASVDGALDYPSMIVADDGTVYAAYYDKTQESTSRYGRVVKYDGSSWVQVGSNISPSPTGGVSGTAFAKGVNGTIYLHLFNWATSRAEVYVVGDSSLTMLDETLPNNNASGGPGQLLVNPVNGRLYSIGEWTGNGLRMTGLFSYSSMPSSGSSIGTAINGAGTGMLSTRGLAFDSTGTGYVSFIDYAAGRNTDVMKRGSNGVWTVLWGAGAIPTATGALTFASYLAVGPDDAPYILFRDGTGGVTNGRVSLMKWNGSSWVYVGGGGLSSGQAGPQQLVFSSDGKPYATYRDLATGYASARYFDGTAWQNVGPSENIVSYASSLPYAAFAPNGDYYVVFNDISPSTGKGPTVMKWDGTTWSQVGNSRFGTFSANTVSLNPLGIQVGLDGVPYVLTSDISTSTTVMEMYLWKFNGSSWVHAAPAIGKFNPATRLEKAPNGDLYVGSVNTVDRGTTAVAAYPITIQRFTGSDWVTIGVEYFGFSQAVAWPAINPINGLPYVPTVDRNGRISILSPLQVLNSSTSVAAVIGAGTVTVESPASIAFPSATTSSSTQTLNFSGGTFTIEDLKGASNGYYVTVSMSDLVSGSSTIGASNISGNVSSSVVTTGGRSNSAVVIPSTVGTIGAWYVPINSATTLVERSSSGGILGRYSVSLDLRLAVPAYASSGTYTGTMTVTLVEN